MGPYRKLWFTLIAVLAVTFSLLGFYGGEVYRQAPPIPQPWSRRRQRLFGRDDILDGQTAWQSVGGMQLGSVWGHGAYQAPDWTADWLHRELSAWLDARPTASPPSCPRQPRPRCAKPSRPSTAATASTRTRC